MCRAAGTSAVIAFFTWAALKLLFAGVHTCVFVLLASVRLGHVIVTLKDSGLELHRKQKGPTARQLPGLSLLTVAAVCLSSPGC